MSPALRTGRPPCQHLPKGLPLVFQGALRSARHEVPQQGRLLPQTWWAARHLRPCQPLLPCLVPRPATLLPQSSQEPHLLSHPAPQHPQASTAARLHEKTSLHTELAPLQTPCFWVCSPCPRESTDCACSTAPLHTWCPAVGPQTCSHLKEALVQTRGHRSPECAPAAPGSRVASSPACCACHPLIGEGRLRAGAEGCPLQGKPHPPSLRNPAVTAAS